MLDYSVSQTHCLSREPLREEGEETEKRKGLHGMTHAHASHTLQAGTSVKLAANSCQHLRHKLTLYCRRKNEKKTPQRQMHILHHARQASLARKDLNHAHLALMPEV